MGDVASSMKVSIVGVVGTMSLPRPNSISFSSIAQSYPHGVKIGHFENKNNFTWL